MALSTDEILAAQELHLFVRNYEKRPMAPMCVGVGTVLMISAINIGKDHAREPHDWQNVFLGVILATFVGFVVGQWLRLRRYRQSCVLLAILERDHGDELPWIKEEREAGKVEEHLKAVRAIQREVSGKQAV